MPEEVFFHSTFSANGLSLLDSSLLFCLVQSLSSNREKLRTKLIKMYGGNLLTALWCFWCRKIHSNEQQDDSRDPVPYHHLPQQVTIVTALVAILPLAATPHHHHILRSSILPFIWEVYITVCFINAGIAWFTKVICSLKMVYQVKIHKLKIFSTFHVKVTDIFIGSRRIPQYILTVNRH